ncbi:MAG: hypothetical protein JXA54_11000 [Candidatus Heimdallarchaeota archaeon]|nr:hypothetical protein [Candidatus Heimdallarchaeota archaeon]
MGKKINILIAINILLILSLSNISPIEASSRSWNPGERYLFSVDNTQVASYYNHNNDAFETTKFNSNYEQSLNVTSINLLNKRYEAILTMIFDAGSLSSYRFGMNYYNETYLNLDSMLGAGYAWDYNHNQSVLSNIGFTLPLWYLIEPDWELFNTGFSEALNATEVIATLAHPYQPLIYNFTFGEFLTSLPAYTIMGKNTLTEAKTKFKDDTIKWSFTLDLSNVLQYGIFNATSGHNDYYPYEKMIFTFELEYTDGGILKNYLNDISYSITIDNITNIVHEYTHIVYGELKALSANFAYLSIIPALLTIVIGSKFASTKRRNR